MKSKRKHLNNLLVGIGSVLDIAPSERHSTDVDKIIKKSDTDAIYSDWAVIGCEIKQAFPNQTARGRAADVKELRHAS